MSFSLSTIQNAIYDWVYAASGNVTTIWRFTNAPRRTKPYIDLSLTTFTSVGEDVLTDPNSLGMASIFGNREVILEINCYGDNSVATMEKLYTSLSSPAILDTLALSGVFFVKKLMQSNTTTLLADATTYEERAILELKFRYSNQGITNPDEVAVGLIENVIAVGEFTGSETDELDRNIDVGQPYTPPPP